MRSTHPGQVLKDELDAIGIDKGGGAAWPRVQFLSTSPLEGRTDLPLLG